MVDRTHLITMVELTKIYNGVVKALDGVNLSVLAGEFLAVMGPSGSGKSTLLNLLGALDRPTSGEIYFSGEKLSKVRDLDRFRSQMVGFVFQMHNLIPTMTARENIEVVMQIIPKSRQERRKRASLLLDIVGLVDKADRLPARLSSGERQRVAIARALANDPQLLLADEPTGNLDTASGSEVMRIFQRLNQEQSLTAVIVTHNPMVARRTNRIVTLRDGRVIRDEPSGNPYMDDLREFRSSGLGQALLSGCLPDEVKALGLEEQLPQLRNLLQRI